MSKPGEAATHSAQPSFQEQVNAAVSGIKYDEKTQKHVLPDNLTEEVKVAAMAEKRRRDAQATLTREQQRIAALEAEKAELLKLATGSTKLELTAEEQAELDDLKFSDPEAWRVKVNDLEKAALKKTETLVNEKLKQVSTSVSSATEHERRKQLLDEYNETNPEYALNDDVIANDIPPRITKKLENGQFTFEEFLAAASNYLKKGKVIAEEKTLEQPNLGRVAGGSEPSAQAAKEGLKESYSTETY
mgnify:CR=1 FL=1